jgi:hypothetical protein
VTFSETRVFASAPDELCDGLLSIVRPAEVLLTIGTDQSGLNLETVIEWDVFIYLFIYFIFFENWYRPVRFKFRNCNRMGCLFYYYFSDRASLYNSGR